MAFEDDFDAFLLRSWGNRLAYLWIVWILAGIAYFFLLVGLMADQLSNVNFTVSTTSIQVLCGWKQFTASSGGASLTETYTDCGSDDCKVQYQAGQAWIAFGILAVFLGAVFVYGCIKDYMAGEFDKEKVSRYITSCHFDLFGFTRLGLISCSVCEFFMLVIYGGREQCSSKNFYIPSVFITSFNYVDGASVGLVAVSFIFIMFIFILTYYVSKYISPEAVKAATDKNNNNNNNANNAASNEQTVTSSSPSPKTNVPPPASDTKI